MNMNRAFQEVPIGLCHLDLELRYVYINDWLAALNGVSPENHLGRTIEEVLPDVADHVAQVLRQVIDSGKPLLNGEIATETPAQPGKLRIFKHDYIPVKSDDNSVIGLSCVVEEITALKKTQKKLKRAKKKAEAASQAKSKFLSSMSHELRTPLNAILGFGQLLELKFKESSDIDVHEYVRHIMQAGNHLLNLVTEVLDLSRIEAGHLNISPEPISLGNTITECINQIDVGLARKHNITMINQASDQNIEIISDPLRLKQVIMNLLSNAVKYNKEAGTVTIKTKPLANERFSITITDTGNGIAAADMRKLFDPFERLSHKDGNVEGSGIGLTVTKQLIEAMGGNLEVESVVGQGSTFMADLPLNISVQRDVHV